MQEPIYKLEGITEKMESELKLWVNKNLEGKMESSFKKIYTKGKDVKVIIRIGISKVSSGYDGSFKFEYDGKSLDYDRQGFEILEDLVNHAFDNFKQRILAK